MSDVATILNVLSYYYLLTILEIKNKNNNNNNKNPFAINLCHDILYLDAFDMVTTLITQLSCLKD